VTRRRYAVIGSPVAHSRSPAMQQAAFDALGIDASYEAIDAPLAHVGAIMARLRDEGYAGWNVTTPLKEAVLPFVDSLSGEAVQARAVNAVRAEDGGTITGHNTDGAGLILALRDVWAWEPRGASALVLGTGPAARAIAAALVSAGIRELFCWSRDPRRALQIGPSPTAMVDLVVSALPPDASLPDSIMQAAHDETLIFDCNYGRSRSVVARMRGRRRSDGLPLLLHQGALSFEWWTSRPAPLAVMRATVAVGNAT
jgi:shikimate dehydrogenase